MNGTRRTGLDFVVFGPARSGTTATVRILNSHPHLYCSRELFHLSDDMSKIAFPDDFISRIRDRGERFSAEQEPIIRDKLEIQACGDKQINYMFDVRGVLAKTRMKKGIFCFRDLEEIVVSGNARAAKSTDPWPEGRIGALLAIDTILGLMSVAYQGHTNCLVGSYNHLVEDPAETASRFHGYLLEGSSFRMRDSELEDLDLKWKQQKRAFQRTDASEADREILHICRSRELTELFYDSGAEDTDALRPQLQSILNTIDEDFLSTVVRHIRKQYSEHVSDYIEKNWMRSRTNIFDRLLRNRRKAGA